MRGLTEIPLILNVMILIVIPTGFYHATVYRCWRCVRGWWISDAGDGTLGPARGTWMLSWTWGLLGRDS